MDGQISLASCLAVRGAIACNGQNDYCTLVANMESISRDLCVEYALTACFVGALLPRISMINIYMSHLRVRSCCFCTYIFYISCWQVFLHAFAI